VGKIYRLSWALAAVIPLLACRQGSESLEAATAAESDANVVQTEAGPVRGVAGDGELSFKGIPFAAPPVGELRWRSPQPAAPWSEVRDASAFGSPCVQIDTKGQFGGGDEDCLTLNVWTPAGHLDASLPVMVFVHGGYYLFGSASEQFHHADGTTPNGTYRYDGSWLAANKNVVVVTLQYRLGVFGFLAHPALAAESGEGSGNFGMLDQIAALRWVQANIQHFGGDPSRVLLFGQSAGGASACALLTSPLARGLFSRVLIQSGSCRVYPRQDAEAVAEAASSALGCEGQPNTLACLRSKPAIATATALPPVLADSTYRWSPTVDGHFLTRQPHAALAAGDFPQIPVVIGNTRDEFSTLLLSYFSKWPTNEDEYKADVRSFFGNRADAILAKYPIANYNDDVQFALQRVMTDWGQVCPARTWARKAAAHTRTWRYLFAHTYDSVSTLTKKGAGHGMELPFIFHDFGPQDFQPDASELTLADTLSTFWTELARTGDPGSAGGVTWASYDATKDDYVALGKQSAMQTGLRSDLCDFWDALPPAH
jgi:para-nitrobenzyl esterase